MNRISVFYEHMAEAMKQENITLDEVCAAVKRFGFDGVELDANRIKNEGDVILPALQKFGLCVNGIYNFFDSPMEWYVVNEAGIHIDAPCLILIDRNDITLCCNITTENIMRELDKWKDFTPFSGHMTTFLLEIIHAFDSNPKERWLLELADTIEDAIEERDKSITLEVDRLNKLQIAKRQRSLNVKEQMELMNIAQKNNANIEFQIGAYILLGQIDIAKELLTRLSKEKKEAFESYPIYNLIKNCN